MSASRKIGYVKEFAHGDRVVIVRGHLAGRRAVVEGVDRTGRQAALTVEGVAGLRSFGWGSLVAEAKWDREHPWEPDGQVWLPGGGSAIF